LDSLSVPNGSKYKARLVDYNNDLATSFEDIQKLLQLVAERLSKTLLTGVNRGI
jgi:hypothetical protein